MVDENQNKNPIQDPKASKEKIKKLELNLKTAFREKHFDEVRKLADELKKIDPKNRLAGRLLEKVRKAELDQEIKAKTEKIKILELRLSQAFKEGRLPDVDNLSDQIKKLDPENKTVKKIQTRIDEAKAALEAQMKKEKIQGLINDIKNSLKNEQWDNAAKKANELLAVEWNHSFALKALKKVAKAKKVEPATLITVPAPPKPSEKPGFWAKLFQKKAEVKPKAKEEIKKPAVPPVAVKVAPPSVKAPTPEEARKEKIRQLEKDLKIALKERREQNVKTLIEEIKKLEPENKAIKKAQVELDKQKVALEAQKKKEKIQALITDIKTSLKNERWDDVAKQTNELLKEEWNHRFALKALKKVAKEKKVEPATLITTPAPPKPSEKPGFWAKLFQKKVEEKPQPEAGPPVAEKEKPPYAEAPPSAVAPEGRPEGKPKEVKKPVFEAKPKESSQSEIPSAGEIKITPAVIVAPPKVVPPPVEKKKPPIALPFKAVPPSKEAVPKVEVKKPVVPPLTVVAEKKPPSALAPEGRPEGRPPSAEAPEAKPEGKPVEENIFTKLFGKKEVIEEKLAKPIIETIVAKAEKVKPVKKKEEISIAEGFLKFASALLQFSVAFIIISAGFFYVQNIDQENRVLSLAGIEENYASRLRKAGQTLEEKKKEEKNLNKEIQRYREGYEDKSATIIQKIREKRLDWPDLIRKLDEVTEFIYEKNKLAQYVKYNNYTYNVDTGQLTVSATLSDPLGKNLTKLAELEEAFRYYPKDKDDPTDTRKPYFFGLQEFRSFSKSFDRSTGRYTSSFSLRLFTKEKND